MDQLGVGGFERGLGGLELAVFFGQLGVGFSGFAPGVLKGGGVLLRAGLERIGLGPEVETQCREAGHCGEKEGLH